MFKNIKAISLTAALIIGATGSVLAGGAGNDVLIGQRGTDHITANQDQEEGANKRVKAPQKKLKPKSKGEAKSSPQRSTTMPLRQGKVNEPPPPPSAMIDGMKHTSDQVSK